MVVSLLPHILEKKQINQSHIKEVVLHKCCKLVKEKRIIILE